VKSKKQPVLGDSYRRRVFSFIKGMVSNESEAEDVLQDVYKEYLEIPDLDEIENIGGWLVQVARNKIFDRFRKRKVEEEYLLLTYERAEETDTSSADENLIRSELREDLAEALASLPDEQREVFILHELEGRSFEEISQITGQKMNTLLSRKRYAVLALREYLKEMYNEL
jgi:RNA polymerase sigma factor (sigma-70 family)